MTLQKLKDKWFVSELTHEGKLGFRHPKNGQTAFDESGDKLELSHSTDGNTLTILGEGEDYITEWANLISSASKVYNQNWSLENVLIRPLGVKAIEHIVNKATIDPNFSFHQILSNHSFGLNKYFSYNLKPYKQLVSNNLPNIHAYLDGCFPVRGSNHQKMMVALGKDTSVALVGSIDINENRYGESTHSQYSITHDFGVKVEGPAVRDLQLCFIERWNDQISLHDDRERINARIKPIPKTDKNISIQVLRTFGQIEPPAILGDFDYYSWANTKYSGKNAGEFSLWSATLNAIKKAEKYIYIESQTFFTFNWPPACVSGNDKTKTTDLVFQLGKAIARGVKVGVLLSNKVKNGVYINQFEKFQRDFSLNYLENIAGDTNNINNFFYATIHNGSEYIYIHSKMFIADDEYAIVGSGNFDQRSMTHDGELKLGIVDGDNQAIKDLRIQLHSEHLAYAPANSDWNISFDDFKNNIGNRNTRLRKYNLHILATTEWLNLVNVDYQAHEYFMNILWSPYAGPKNLR